MQHRTLAVQVLNQRQQILGDDLRGEESFKCCCLCYYSAGNTFFRDHLSTEGIQSFPVFLRC